jgi:hypothetical protein
MGGFLAIFLNFVTWFQLTFYQSLYVYRNSDNIVQPKVYLVEKNYVNSFLFHSCDAKSIILCILSGGVEHESFVCIKIHFYDSLQDCT